MPYKHIRLYSCSSPSDPLLASFLYSFLSRNPNNAKRQNRKKASTRNINDNAQINEEEEAEEEDDDDKLDANYMYAT